MADVLKAGIITAVKADAGLGALIGDRIYSDMATQDIALPYVTIQRRGDTGIHHQTGVTGKVLSRIQFNVWALTSDSRSAVSEALRDLFDGAIRQTFGAANCDGVVNTNNIDVVEDKGADGSQIFIYGVHMDFEFSHNR